MKRLLIALLSLVLLLACVPTPEEDAVKQKDTVAMVDTVLEANANDSDGAKNAVKDQMPGRLVWDYRTETRQVPVNGDVPIRIMTDSTFPLLRCERRQFTAEEKIAIAKALLGTDKVYAWQYQLTKEDLEREIEDALREISPEEKAETMKDFGMTEADWDALMEKRQERLVSLQEKYRNLEDGVPLVLSEWDGMIEGGGQLFLVGAPDQTDEYLKYSHVAHFEGPEDPKDVSVSFMRKGERDRMPKSEAEGELLGNPVVTRIETDAYNVPIEGTNLVPAVLIAKMQQILAPFGSFTVADVFSVKEYDGMRCRISMTPLYYGDAAATFLTLSSRGKDEEESHGYRLWPRETVVATWDENGLCDFDWNFPLRVTEVVSDNCPLLPFDEIESIAKQQINRVYATEYWSDASITITGVTLGLVRIAEPYQMDQALLVPVWCFFGTVEKPGFYTWNYGADEPLLMINAIDGTIIDARKGY
jgi:hypothetical protein